MSLVLKQRNFMNPLSARGRKKENFFFITLAKFMNRMDTDKDMMLVPK